jgi:dipeptidyl aminopeptidase/acylaminoacyl peptidase
VSTVASFGSWSSPITPQVVAGAGVGLQAPQPTAAGVCWIEGRPLEGGRYVLVRRTPDGRTVDVTPEGFNVRTRVHEYGGIAFLVDGQDVVFSNFADQRLYRQPLEGGEPRPITPEPPSPAAYRYADLERSPDGSLLFCVRERHEEDGVFNELAVLRSDGSAPPRTVVEGNDFYSFPRVSPDGRYFAWTTWNHPNMPWDGTELWVADLSPDGDMSGARLVAGGASESIYQPAWSPNGVLHFVSDRTGWWNIYRERDGAVEPLMELEAEFGVPQWVLGTSTYAFMDEDHIACIYTVGGFGHLAVFDGSQRSLHDLDVPFTSFGVHTLRAEATRLHFVGSLATEASAVVELDAATGEITVLKRSMELELDRAFLSVPRAVDFPTEDEWVAHAIFYPPTNPDFDAPPGDRPPLLVLSHGGPTGRTQPLLNLEIQFWTTRGFAVVDVNYRGSTGHGRAYRDALKGAWGVADVEDCVNAGLFLADSGEADPGRLCIRGGSAGGYTTLCALTFRDEFAAGASYYGIGDLETMVRDTHKFESRYLDSLIGPYPEAFDLYRQRSPVHHVERMSTPVIILQGLEDEIVPPNQAEDMVAALRKNGIPFAYLAFEGEQHGFRKAETIERCQTAELYFYSKVLGFALGDPVEPVQIENL